MSLVASGAALSVVPSVTIESKGGVLASTNPTSSSVGAAGRDGLEQADSRKAKADADRIIIRSGCS